MQPISRRVFLASAAAVVIAACSDDSDGDGSDGDGSNGDTSVAGTVADTAVPSTEAATTTVAPTTTLPTVELSGDPFTLGVASGDPDATGVVLWTRLAPTPLDGGGMPADDVDVVWETSASSDFATLADSGTETATAAHGHSVHATVTLEPGLWYYRFRVGEYTSPVGVTRAAPATDVAVASARFAVGSCQNYAHGYYAAHRDIVEQQPDFMVWLGDYIYEGAEAPDNGTGRTHVGPEPTTVEQYRNRYALYKSDPQLQAAHAAYPWFVIWDDHEVENNYADLTPQDPADADGFQARRFAAYQAWWEHQPVRLAAPTAADQEYRIYRDFQWGDLIELALLDGRQYRSDQACGDAQLNLDPACPETFDPARTMLGDAQSEWLVGTLAGSNAAWNVVGNQVVFADATFNGAVLNYDQWDGYPATRTRLLQAISDAGVGNLVVVTGDIHLAAVAHLRAGAAGVGDPVGVEFITTSIASDGLIGDELTEVLKTFPDLVDAELAHRGYSLHTVTPERWTSEYRIVTDVDDPDSTVTVYGSYTVDAGSNTVVKAT
ncbi:MAG: alkaline phosphatase D family protein [Actinomycetota bacterium]|nr:alkaline phosphatase D family protein [Actinomycetota bacterium]